MDNPELVIALLATFTSLVATAIAYSAYRSQTDPDVIVYLEHDEKRPSLILLVIENRGSGVAHDVQFEIPDDFPSDPIGITATGKKSFERMTEGPLISGIKSLPPKGKRILNWGQYGGIYDYMGAYHKTIKVRFKRRKLFGLDDQTFETESDIEVISYSRTDASNRSEATHLKKISETLVGIEKQLNKMNK
ncbi:MAG: hypothetical protein AAF065_06395 [Verrucomicrobiota bacterium]